MAAMRMRYRVRRARCVRDFDVEIAVLDEGTRIGEIERRIETCPLRVLLDEALIRERAFAEALQKAVARRRVPVKIVFLEVLAPVPRSPVRPKARSLSIGSLPFQSARAKHSAASRR
jgi:hypothetical protein